MVPCERGEALLPAWREKRFHKTAGRSGKLRSVTEPPGFRDARQTVNINIFYLNHFVQSKARVRASPTAGAGSAVRRFADAVIARDVVDHYGARPNPRRNFGAAARIRGPHAGGQSEGRIVR